MYQPESISVVMAPVPSSLPVYSTQRLISVSLCIVSVNDSHLLSSTLPQKVLGRPKSGAFLASSSHSDQLPSTRSRTSGGTVSLPPLVRDRVDGSWSLWEELAKKAPDFGRPNTFCGNVDESKWESFTLTMHSDTLIKRWVEYTGNELGTGAMTTLIDSGWYMSALVVGQPHFANQPEGTYTMWGWGLEIENEGDYVKKKMSQATGTEILTELIHQLGFEDILQEVLATTDVTTSMMPYASALFARRVRGDRPTVIPDLS